MKAQKTRALTPVLMVAAAFLLQGCATVVRGTSQKIPVTSTPVGAKVLVDGKEAGTTPLILKLKRKKPAVIRIELEGYDPHEIRIVRKKASQWEPYSVFGNMLLAAPGTLWLGHKLADSFTKKDPDNIGEALTNAWLATAAGYGLAMLIFATPLAVTDGLSGASYSLSPRSLEVELTPAAGAPRVGRTEIPASALKDVTWLRIRLARPSGGLPRPL